MQQNINLPTVRTKYLEKIKMETTEGCCVLFYPNPRNNTQQNHSFMVIYVLSCKPSQKDEQYMIGIAAEVRANS